MAETLGVSRRGGHRGARWKPESNCRRRPHIRSAGPLAAALASPSPPPSPPTPRRAPLSTRRLSLYRPPAMTRNATRLSRSRTPPLAIPRLAAPCALSSDGRHEVKPSFGAPSQAARRAAALVARLSHLTAAYFTVAPSVGDVRPAQNLPLFTTCRGAQSAEIRFPSHC